MNKKIINYENGITYFLTTNSNSYAKLAVDIENNLRLYGNSSEITERRVNQWAHGTLPQGKELDALTLLAFGDKDKWRELYFPSDDFTLHFIKNIINNQVPKVLQSSDIASFINNRTLTTLYSGLNDKDVTLNTLTSILITKIYHGIRNKELINTSYSSIDFNFQNYQQKIPLIIAKKLDSISANSTFIKNTRSSLKRVLVKNGTNRTNIKREVLRQIIIVI